MYNDSSKQEEIMSERDVITAIFAKLESIDKRTGTTESDVKVIKNTLDMIDKRGSQKSSEDIEALNTKVNRAHGAAAILYLIFGALLAKIGFK